MSPISHNSYFDGGVQSLGFERDDRRCTVGVISAGSYRFDTDAPERMTVVFGELEVLLAGADQWVSFTSGAVFEVPGTASFEVRSTASAAYLCEFL